VASQWPPILTRKVHALFQVSRASTLTIEQRRSGKQTCKILSLETSSVHTRRFKDVGGVEASPSLA
jgi:hypothetical protein